MTPPPGVFNRHAVGTAQGGRVVILMPPRHAMTRAEAVELAAWLVAVSGADVAEFSRAFDAVVST